jgi:hypothetical protein
MTYQFSEQAKKLIKELKLNEAEIIEWHENATQVIGGGEVHHYLIDKVEGRFNPKKNGS